jgi:hypothetical protein
MSAQTAVIRRHDLEGDPPATLRRRNGLAYEMKWMSAAPGEREAELGRYRAGAAIGRIEVMPMRILELSAISHQL